jgi:hypothetical protein
MDRAPASKPNFTSRLVAMALALARDPVKVKRCLKCSDQDFEAYCLGEKDLPLRELDRLIVLIVEEQALLIDQNRKLLTRVREYLLRINQ